MNIVVSRIRKPLVQSISRKSLRNTKHLLSKSTPYLLNKSNTSPYQYRNYWDLVQKSKPFGLKLIPLKEYSSRLPVPPQVSDKKIKYCLSYLSPDDMEDCKIIPKEAIVGWITETPPKDQEGNYQILPDTFIENESFVNMMHSTIRNYVRGNITDEEASASVELLNGVASIPIWDNVIDDLDGEATRPSTEHICGSVNVVDGNVVDYVPNFAFRLVTSKGVYELGKCLEEEIIRKLKDMCSREFEIDERG